MTDKKSFTISGLGHGNTTINAVCNVCGKKIELSGPKLPMAVDSMEFNIRSIFSESSWSLDAELHPVCPDHTKTAEIFKKCALIGKQGIGMIDMDGGQ